MRYLILIAFLFVGCDILDSSLKPSSCPEYVFDRQEGTTYVFQGASFKSDKGFNLVKGNTYEVCNTGNYITGLRAS